MHRTQLPATPNVRGPLAVGLFVVMLIAFVLESELTQHVQTTLGYRQPFFLFYLVHSSFTIIFPLHLLYLLVTTNYTAVSLLKGLKVAVTNHLAPRQRYPNNRFPTFKFIRLCLALTVGITCPGLLWFAAVSLASVSDVTAIWNTNAFFAYIISVKLFNLKWEKRKLIAVTLATAGVLAVVYGGSTEGPPPTEETKQALENANTDAHATSLRIKPSAPLLGNLLTLVASFGYGLYQVLYKIYASLPSDPEAHSVTGENYEHIPAGPGDEGEEFFDDPPPVDLAVPDVSHNNTAIPAHAHEHDQIYPPPFGLYPNALTSMLGLFTALILWIPIPLLHQSGLEPFRLPQNMTTVISIAGIALSGVAFNASFMVLLGMWGPIIVSVGNLLTIVLVLISDIIFGSGLEALTLWSCLGSGVIVLAFGVLAYDMFAKQVSDP